MKKAIITLVSIFCIFAAAQAQTQLWGMTPVGGAHEAGVIFKINNDGSGFQSLYSFDTVTGINPNGCLLMATNGLFYGTSFKGGVNDAGGIFSYDPVNKNYSYLEDFNWINGEGSEGSLMQASNGKLYGTTDYGGDTANSPLGGYGVIFTYNISTNTYTDLYHFQKSTGAYPNRESLLQGQNGKLYGLAYGGGAYNNGLGYGVIFSYDTAAHTYLDLHDFDSINGFKPLGGLIEATNGKYYGLTPLGGTNDKGTLFSFDPSTNNFTSLYSFNQTTGWYPRGSLKQATDGKLYGMARSGGLNNMGVIFSYDIVLNSYTDLFDFTDVGGYSFGSLIESTNGKLYGMTYSGSSGANTIGNIFYFDPSLNSVSYLHTFNGADGGYPVGDLTETSYIVVPVNLLVDGTVTNNTVCYNATNMITVAGDPPTFTVQSGGHVEMIAGVAIDYKPGTTVQSGGYMWGHITPSGPWCVPITAPSIVTVPMGIEKVQEQSFFKVYPNPTTGSFILELSEVSETSVVKIEIYGMRGEKILNDQFTGEKRHEFSLESNPTGIYFIRVFCGDNLGSQKIIKQ